MSTHREHFERTVESLLNDARRLQGARFDAIDVGKAYLSVAVLLLHETAGTDATCDTLVNAAMELARRAPKGVT